MDKQIRILTMEDLPFVEAMDTGIEDDYVIRVFKRISSGNNRMFGLFWDDRLVSVGGYTIFAKSYAMLGRMRSDLRYRGNDLSTRLMSHVIQEVFKIPDIKWVGANTQEENSPARRVLTKLGLQEHATLFGATTQDVSMFSNGEKPWREVRSLESKKKWLDELYIKTGAVFPFECYYPFPATADLFPEDRFTKWRIFENDKATRVLITKRDFKRDHYLQAIYPWDDLLEQPGLWETIASAHKEMTHEINEEVFIWMDLTKESIRALPENHQFKLPSPWILHGTERKTPNSAARN